MRLRALFVLAVTCAASVAAAPLERDLGQGLRLYRLHALPADLPPPGDAAGRPAPCVVDVRYLRADTDAATAFEAWLRFRAKPRVPVFVLANGETSNALLRSLASRPAGAGIVLIGVPAKNLEPDVAVKTGADEERKAYDALENGASIAALLTDNPDKVRNDEASLSKDRLAEASAGAVADAAAPKRTPPPIDATLQRAVHLHRSLIALRKL